MKTVSVKVTDLTGRRPRVETVELPFSPQMQGLMAAMSGALKKGGAGLSDPEVQKALVKMREVMK